MKKAALYLRRSTDRQPQSLEAQEKTCLEYAEAEGYEVVRTYRDDAKSGTNAHSRNGFLQMMEDAQSPTCPFSYILVYDVSRFGRVDNDEAGFWRHILHRHGVEVIYVKENFNGDDSDDLVRSVRQWQARDESVKRSMLTIRGQVSRARKGHWNGGMPPYGYDLQYSDAAGVPYMRVRFVPDGSRGWTKEIYDTKGKLTRVLGKGQRIPVPKDDKCELVLGAPEKVTVVRRIFDLYTKEDLGFWRIAETLNSEGIPASHGGVWLISGVRDIIRNPVYAGAMVWNRRSFAKIHRVKGEEEKRLEKSEQYRQRSNSGDDWIIVPGAHPAIVDPETFDRAQRTHRSRKEKHYSQGFRAGRGKNSPYLLSGLIRCARCGRGYQGYSPWRKKRRRTSKEPPPTYYVCNGYVNGSKSVCPRTTFRKDELEGQVLELVGAKVDAILAGGGRAKLKSLIARSVKEDRGDPSGEIKETRKGLRETEQTKKRLVASLTAKNKEFLDEEFVELARRKRDLEARLKELESMKHKEVDIDATVAEIMAAVKRFKDVFPYGTLGERKELIRLFVDSIVLDPDKRVGRVFTKRLPAPKEGAMASLMVLVAGARYTHQKRNFPPVDEIDIQFEYQGSALVPVGV